MNADLKTFYENRLDPYVAAIIFRLAEKQDQARRSGSKTPILDSLEGEPADFRQAFMEDELMAPLIAVELATMERES